MLGPRDPAKNKTQGTPILMEFTVPGTGSVPLSHLPRPLLVTLGAQVKVRHPVNVTVTRSDQGP